MDKKTLFFVISLSLTLYLVNTFFDYQNQEARKVQEEQQAVKHSQDIQKTQSFKEERTASAADLPLIKIYGDKDRKQFLTTGVLSDGNILVLSWGDQLPKEVYGEANGTLQQYTLQSGGKGSQAAALYSLDPKVPLQIGKIADFGTYELQTVTPTPGNADTPFHLSVAEMVNGVFSLPEEKIADLRKKMAKPGEKTTTPTPKSSIVLIKQDDKYLPVAIYDAKAKALRPLKSDTSITTATVKPEHRENGERPPEEFYVLENAYQQLVFSTYGGALAEINLPFESKTDEESVVKEIGFDRKMVEHHPYNAHFPAHSYHSAGENPKGPFVEHDSGQLGGYYPLIRRDLIEKGTRPSVMIEPKYYSLNIVSQYPEVAETVYKVTYFDKSKIVFESKTGQRHITKTYTLDTDVAPYVLNLSIKIDGDSRGLWLTSGVPEVELISGSPAPALKYRMTKGDKSEVKLVDLPSETTTFTALKPDWICNSNGFFGIIMDSLNGTDPGYRAEFIAGTAVPTRLVEIDQEYDLYKADKYPGYEMMLPLWSRSGGSTDFRVFAGPFSTPILKQVDAAYSDPSTGYNPDYIACQTFHGWFSFISEPFAKFLFLLMNFFHSITGSWALSIVLLTVALRLMLYPLSAWSTRSMLRTQEIMPKVQAVQQKYKNDPKRAQLEVLNVYREHGVNPLSGMAGGCFPLLIQMPFLIGMFDLLKSSFQLRGATFIPGWINDLAAPDVLFSWTVPIPLIGNEFHLLPILLGVIMWLQPRIMSPLPKDPNQWTEQQRQQRAMGNIMAVVFTWMFYNFPSGLNIYWISSMSLGMLQQWWNKRNIKPLATKDVVLDVAGKASNIQGKGKKSNKKT